MYVTDKNFQPLYLSLSTSVNWVRGGSTQTDISGEKRESDGRTTPFCCGKDRVSYWHSRQSNSVDKAPSTTEGKGPEKGSLKE